MLRARDSSYAHYIVSADGTLYGVALSTWPWTFSAKDIIVVDLAKLFLGTRVRPAISGDCASARMCYDRCPLRQRGCRELHQQNINHITTRFINTSALQNIEYIPCFCALTFRYVGPVAFVCNARVDTRTIREIVVGTCFWWCGGTRTIWQFIEFY